MEVSEKRPPIIMEKKHMKEEKFKYIFSLKMAGFLMMNGQRIVRINHNLNVSNKDVYVFVDTPELCQLMSEYTDKHSKEKYYDFNTGNRSKS